MAFTGSALNRMYSTTITLSPYAARHGVAPAFGVPKGQLQQHLQSNFWAHFLQNCI